MAVIARSPRLGVAAVVITLAALTLASSTSARRVASPTQHCGASGSSTLAILDCTRTPVVASLDPGTEQGSRGSASAALRQARVGPRSSSSTPPATGCVSRRSSPNGRRPAPTTTSPCRPSSRTRRRCGRTRRGGSARSGSVFTQWPRFTGRRGGTGSGHRPHLVRGRASRRAGVWPRRATTLGSETPGPSTSFPRACGGTWGPPAPTRVGSSAACTRVTVGPRRERSS